MRRLFINNFQLWRVILLVSLLFWPGHSIFAQDYVVSPTIPDFTDITAACVVATTGSTGDPFARQGLVAGRHEVISRQGTDEYTGDALKFLPPGVEKVVRLGNPDVNNEAESITYHFRVDEKNPVLFLQFAVVFEDPSHALVSQPRFVVRIMDPEGELIETCAEYDVSARPGIDGFHSFNKWGTPIRWRDWTNVGLDMSRYTGREVQVQFLTYDCNLSAHFGYAYFTASCISNQLTLQDCRDDTFTVAAPGGFASYLWQDGRTTASTVWRKDAGDTALSCEITSATGCRFTLSAQVSDDANTPSETVFTDTICEGDAYTLNNYNLPPQKDVGTAVYYNNYLNLDRCGSDGLTTLNLTILPRYYPIEAELCPGESYVANGFTYHTPAAGIYYDTLRYTIVGARCDSVVVLRLTVFPEVAMTGDIAGMAAPCVGSTQAYTMQESWEDGSYEWQFPAGFYVIKGQGTPEVTVQLTDDAQAGVVTLMYGKEGCALGLDPFVVTPRPSYWLTITDTLCTGTEYHNRGFHVPPLDTAGFIPFRNAIPPCLGVIAPSLFIFMSFRHLRCALSLPIVSFVRITQSVSTPGAMVQSIYRRHLLRLPSATSSAPTARS